MEPETKSNGALLGSIIIVIILVIGGVYLWKVNLEKRMELENTAPASDATSLEADLNSTDLDSLDSGI